MSSPTIIVNPLIAGVVAAASTIGAVTQTLSWPTAQPLCSFHPGTGANQLDVFYDAVRPLASATAESLDLTGTTLIDMFGVPVALGHVKLLAFLADPTNTTDLTIGNAANPFVGPFGAGTHTVILKPGDFAMFMRPTTGYLVTNATADLLQISNAAGAAAKYSLLIGGTST
jgi:hypothetical protein